MNSSHVVEFPVSNEPMLLGKLLAGTQHSNVRRGVFDSDQIASVSPRPRSPEWQFIP